MQVPAITASYLGVLALIYAFLSIRVVRLRGKYQVSFGDGDNATLKSAIRSHAHFAEYVPLIVLMIALLEMAGTAPARLHVLLGALLLARILHPLGIGCASDLAVPAIPRRRRSDHLPAARQLRGRSAPALRGSRLAIRPVPALAGG